MDFFATETLNPSEGRLEALRNVGRLVSQAMERLKDAQELRNKVDQLLNVVTSAAQGDLTQEVTVTGEDAVGELATGLKTMLMSRAWPAGESPGQPVARGFPQERA